jgi:chaperonin GroES
MAKFRPLHDRLLVQRLEEEEKSKGGIIIPDTAKEKPQQGRVLAVGPGRRDENGELMPLDVRSGDKVLFAKYAGTEIKIDGEDRVILREEDVLAIVE